MANVIELLKDVWGYGCKGDVVTLTDEALAKLKKLGEDVYQEVKVETEKVETETKDAVDAVKKALDTAKAKDATEGKVTK